MGCAVGFLNTFRKNFALTDADMAEPTRIKRGIMAIDGQTNRLQFRLWQSDRQLNRHQFDGGLEYGSASTLGNTGFVYPLAG